MPRDDEDRGIRVSSWVAGIAAVLACGAIAAGAAAIMKVERMEVRVTQLEASRASLDKVPEQLARLEEQMKAVQMELTKVSAKLDEKRR